MKPSDILNQNYAPNILIFGFAGCGKTALATQLSKGYGQDFDNGMRTAATLKDKFFDARSKFEFETFRDENPTKPTAYMRAKNKLNEIVRLSSEGKWPFDAYIADSLTGLCKAAQLHVLSIGRQNSMAKMEIQDWGALVHEVENFLTLIRSLKVLTVVTAHIDILDKPMKKGGKTVVGERETLAMYPMSATAKHGLNKLMWLFDEVLYADVKPLAQGKMKYTISGASQGIIKTRTRSSFGTIRHDEIGMVEILKQMGYNYGEKGCLT